MICINLHSTSIATISNPSFPSLNRVTVGPRYAIQWCLNLQTQPYITINAFGGKSSFKKVLELALHCYRKAPSNTSLLISRNKNTMIIHALYFIVLLTCSNFVTHFKNSSACGKLLNCDSPQLYSRENIPGREHNYATYTSDVKIQIRIAYLRLSPRKTTEKARVWKKLNANLWVWERKRITSAAGFSFARPLFRLAQWART